MKIEDQEDAALKVRNLDRGTLIPDPRAKNDVIKPEQIIILEPGQTAPPFRILLANGEIIDSSFPDDMSEEEQTAWFDNMMASDPSDIE